jgi:predicted DNA-binding protein with PD1-like motif
MKSRKVDRCFIMRLEKGEEVMKALRGFLLKEKISSAAFKGIGALQHATIGFYDLSKKKYYWQDFRECEALSLSGNASLLKKGLFIHAHIVLSDSTFCCYGGHLKEAVVGATLEIVLQPFKAIERKFDRETGLNLLDL